MHLFYFCSYSVGFLIYEVYTYFNERLREELYTSISVWYCLIFKFVTLIF